MIFLISNNTGYGHEGKLCHYLLDNVSLLSVQKDCSVKVWCGHDVMMMSLCKLWNTDNGKDIRTFQFTNHDYSNTVIHYISLSPEDEWLAASISVGVTIVSIIIIMLQCIYCSLLSSQLLHVQYKLATTSP